MNDAVALPPEDVRDYPRPPRLEPAGCHVRVLAGGREIAATPHALRVLETFHAPTYYLPMASIAPGVLRPNPQRSMCEWKGAARYFDLVAAPGARPVRAAAWTYPEPTPAFAALREHVAIYAGAVDAAWVGDVRVIPQPGDFYGGWVTPNLTGPIKGAPGTRHW